MPNLLRPKQLAEYLQLSQRTVYRLLERGDIPGVKVGGQWRFRRTAVDEWLDLSIQRLDAASLDALERDAAATGRLCLEPRFLPALREGRTGDDVVDLVRRTEDRVFVGAP